MSIRGKDKENKSNIKVNKKGKNILGEIFLGNIGNTVWKDNFIFLKYSNKFYYLIEFITTF